jgi:hypothetical protein
MTTQPKTFPSCFGELDAVFPLGEDGLRHSPAPCLPCEHKTLCLRSAMDTSGGLDAREEVVDRAYTSGVIGFFERWSKKKNLKRRKKRMDGG